MSEYDSNEYNQEKIKKIENIKKNKKIMQKYYSNGYLLENQALRNGFGKMIKAINQTNPKYSFGKEKRFFSVFKNDDLPYEHRILEDEKYGNINIGYHNKVNNRNKGNNNFTGTFNHDSYTDLNKKPNLKKLNFISSSNNATDYYYIPPPTHYYKHNKSPKWGFSKSKRSLYDDKGKYEYYNIPYNRKIDLENINQNWRSHIIGGDIGLDERFIENRKLAEKIETPGPGRYNPKDIYFKFSNYPGGYMGMKLDSCEPLKHKNLKKELNECFVGNEKIKKPIGRKRVFVFHNKIKFDFGKDNHLNNTFNKINNYPINRNEKKFISIFKKNFSLDEKKILFPK